MIPRHTGLYLPVLHVLSDGKTRQVSQLIEDTANFIHLTPEERKVPTRAGKNIRYISNIQWAITDLSQAGFISKPTRAHYCINNDGLAFLQLNPENPNRDTLSEFSPQFKEFMSRKGTRSKVTNEDDHGSIESIKETTANLDNVSPVSEHDPSEHGVDEEITLKELYALMRQMRKAKLSTDEVEKKASALEERLIQDRVLPILSQNIAATLSEIERSLVIVVDYTPGQEVRVSLTRRRDISTIIEAKEIKA